VNLSLMDLLDLQSDVQYSVTLEYPSDVLKKGGKIVQDA